MADVQRIQEWRRPSFLGYAHVAVLKWRYRNRVDCDVRRTKEESGRKWIVETTVKESGKDGRCSKNRQECLECHVTPDVLF